MKYKQYALLSAAFIFFGALLYSVQKNWIIFRFPTYQFMNPSKTAASKKNVTLFWFAHDTWQKDTQTILWDEPQENTKRLLNIWLDNALQEEYIHHDIHVESVAITGNNEITVSIDGPLFSTQSSIFEKTAIVESIIKTVQKNIPSIQGIHILLHHELYLDPHLDFSVSWASTGYTQL